VLPLGLLPPHLLLFNGCFVRANLAFMPCTLNAKARLEAFVIQTELELRAQAQQARGGNSMVT
jgi:hypothetical protein